MSTSPPLLELRGITKRFGRFVANNSVDFTLNPGEIHTLLGENGAGKSTLMGTIYGLHHPDSGEISLEGKKIRIDSPQEAIDHGIAMVHQHFMLIPVMTVAENVVLASEPHRGPMLNRSAAIARVKELSQRFGLAVHPDARVEDLSVGEQQRVEILRSLHRRADILILDEPTAVLTATETQDLFKVLRNLSAQGTAIIFISHKLNEVLEISDRITILRRGEKVTTINAAGKTEEELATLMVGREVLFRLAKEPVKTDKTRLRVKNLNVLDDRGLPAVSDASFEVHGGEIVGIAGVGGNGQTELIEAITGLRIPDSGSIEVNSREISGQGVRKALAAGVGHIAEDRHRRGLVLDFSLTENLCLREYRRGPLARLGFLSPRRMRARAKEIIKGFDVRGAETAATASALSGGNQQKLVIARELANDPTLLIAAQPTRGLDVGAIEFVHQRLLAQRAAGRAVLLVSLELEEIRSLADRILVMYEGEIVAEFAPDVSDEDLGVAMLGGLRMVQA